MSREIPADVLDWLLQPDNAPVRYLTLTNLLGKRPQSPEVRQARAGLMEYAPTQQILGRTGEFAGQDKDRAYWKYTGKYWQLIFLGQFLADGKDPRISGWAQPMLEDRPWVSRAGGQCLTANILAAFRRLGYDDHPTVTKETEDLAERVLADRGIRCSAMQYSLLPLCHMAQPKLLLSFSLVPPHNRSAIVNSAIRKLVQNLLETEVFIYLPGHQSHWQTILAHQPKREQLGKGQTVKAWLDIERQAFLKSSGLGPRRPKPGWLKFGFPLHYNSDVLESTYALALAGVPMCPELEKPVQAIHARMTKQGTWILENSLNGKMLADVEEKGKPSKWLTYFGHFVLRHFAGTQ